MLIGSVLAGVGNDIISYLSLDYVMANPYASEPMISHCVICDSEAAAAQFNAAGHQSSAVHNRITGDNTDSIC